MMDGVKRVAVHKHPRHPRKSHKIAKPPIPIKQRQATVLRTTTSVAIAYRVFEWIAYRGDSRVSKSMTIPKQ